MTGTVGITGVAEPREPPIDSGLAALVLLARYHGVAVEPEALRHQFALGDRPFAVDDLLRAAKVLDLKARCVTSSAAQLSTTPMPCMAERADGSFLILGAADDTRVLVQDPAASAPAAL